ncbi:Anaphase-promoting complex, cyclosome, subunit 3 [Rosistilla carotiformis]|uniref:Anaphase-promoting complex, cyclosome, subunit 3 n=1 Tax=Rosistilla carotiformis TaxID=2528017 RepID=A0A518JX72_9BACT|nr:hypothetical protein [Rosistilla carotiformis]QDV70143.1 Anaphase-promoting complex, cyclosome, subunit 3 [Rosistilla carotiformis]
MMMFPMIPRWLQQNRSWLPAAAVLACCLIETSAFGQAKLRDGKDDPLQRQLSSDEFSDRQNAMHRMWELGDEAEVHAAGESDDPEVRLRARWIQEQWKLGIRHQTPDHVARLLRGNDSENPASLAELIRLEQLGQLNVALRESESQTFRNLVQMDLLKNFPYLSYLALERNQSEPFIELLGEMSHMPIVALRRGQMMFQRGDSRDECLTFSKAAETMQPAGRHKVAVFMRWAMGMQAEAIALAAEEDLELTARLQLAALDWTGLVETAEKLVADVEVPEPIELDDLQKAATYLIRCREKATPLSLSIVGLHRSGQTEACDAAVDQLVEWVTSAAYLRSIDTLQSESRRHRTDLTTAAFESAETLIAVDRPHRAIEVLEKTLPLQAAELLVHQTQYQRALQVLGVDPATLETSLLTLADEVLQEADSEDSSLSTQAFERCLAACSLAYQLGYAPAARQALRRAAPMTRGEGILRRLEVVESVLQRNDPTFAIELAQPLLMMPSSDGRTTEALFGSSVGNELWHALGQLEPEWTVPERARVLVDLSHGKLPVGWNRSIDLNRLATWLHDQLISDDGQFNASLSREIAQFFKTYARDDWADSFFRLAAQHNDYDAFMALAQRQFQLGNVRTAAELYQDIWERFSNHPETLVGLSKARRLAGQEDEASAITERLDMLALDAAQYYDIAVAFGQFDDSANAVRYANKVIRDTPENSARSYHYRALRLLLGMEYDKSPREVARLNQRLLDRTLSPTMLRDMGSYQAIVFDHYEAAARQAVADGNAPLATRQMALALNATPTNIDFAEKELLELRDQGHVQFADQTLDTIFESANAHLIQFPLNANMANNIAWVAAIHHRHLDRALELSMSAVAQFPESYSYRDTLAEVLYRNGQVEQAIQVETNCLLDVPDDYHLHEQLKRFRAGN